VGLVTIEGTVCTTPLRVTLQLYVSAAVETAQLVRAMEVNSDKTSFGTIVTTEGPWIDTIGKLGLSSTTNVADALLYSPKKFFSVKETV